MLHRWMVDNNSSNWAWGIHFVQHEKNIRRHTGIKAVPYELLYGQQIRVGLSDSHMSKDLMESLFDEEDLLDHFPSLAEAEVENEPSQPCSEPINTSLADIPSTENSQEIVVECANSLSTDVFTQATMQLNIYDGETPISVESALENIISGSCTILNDDPTPPQSPTSECRASPTVLEFDTPNRGLKRAQAAESMTKQAAKMRKYAGGREEFKKFLSVGDVVLLKAQKVDRGRCDPTQFPGVVVGVTSTGSYRIGCVGGVLQTTYQRMDLLHKNVQCPALYDLQEILEAWQTAPVITEREAIAKISPVGGQGVKRCSCSTGCTSNRCACKKAGVLCNSRCHVSCTVQCLNH